MNPHPTYLYIERTQPSKNMARFYALSIEPSLFGQASLVRRWGRIGTTGREKIHLFEDEAAALALFLQVARQKRQRGYRPRPFRSNHSPDA
ncbi:WGR domain-containing protein [Rhizobium sp. DKSPLA3]|uniref:WGR domain-containing protein n=1 Tax=Rhizobium quercicola TaxID=2901226 RepID=A0A9X1NPP2_9HYPH|nr:WGR domain-containing protein [Rhizobium quercicola]MCD7107729.1 WGR domain-containing protein [Rhizobium quercicola]